MDESPGILNGFFYSVYVTVKLAFKKVFAHRDLLRMSDRYKLLDICGKLQYAIRKAREEGDEITEEYINCVGAFKDLQAELRKRVQVHYHERRAAALKSGNPNFQFTDKQAEEWMTRDELRMKQECFNLHRQQRGLKQSLDMVMSTFDKFTYYHMKFSEVYRLNENAILMYRLNEPLESIAGMNVQTILDNVGASLHESVDQIGNMDKLLQNGSEVLQATQNHVRERLFIQEENDILGLPELLGFKQETVNPAETNLVTPLLKRYREREEV